MNTKVTVIEDDAVLGSFIIEELRASQINAYVVRVIEEAITQITSSNPTLVVVDIAVGKEKLQAFLTAKNNTVAIRDVPVVLFSRSSEMIDTPDACAQNVLDWVEHVPAEVSEIVDLIRRNDGSMPKSDSQRRSASANMGKKSILSGQRVLWVEDDKFLADILTKKFLSVGCDIVRTKTAEETYTFLEQAKPTELPKVIILDILLPGEDGLAILQKIKMNPAWKPIPAMILSNTSQSSDLEKSRVLGAQKFLVKASVSLDEIIREVSALVR